MDGTFADGDRVLVDRSSREPKPEGGLPAAGPRRTPHQVRRWRRLAADQRQRPLPAGDDQAGGARPSRDPRPLRDSDWTSFITA